MLLEDVLLGDSAKGSAKDELEIAQAGANEPGTPGSEPEGIPSEGPTDRVISEAYAYLMSDLLSAVVQEGTGRGLRRLGRPLAGKTGTTNEQGDAWFMGFSPDLTTGVWVGHDDNRLLGFGETGAGAALPVWRDFMRVALADREIRDFEVPGELIVFERIDRETGLLADSSTQNAYFQPFLEGTEPERSVSEQKSASDSRRALRDDIF